MLIGIISANASLSPRMFYNRVDIFNITLLQLVSKLVKVIFLKIVTIFSWRNFSNSYVVLAQYIIAQIKEIFKLLWAIESIWHYGGCLNKRAARLRPKKHCGKQTAPLLRCRLFMVVELRGVDLQRSPKPGNGKALIRNEKLHKTLRRSSET